MYAMHHVTEISETVRDREMSVKGSLLKNEAMFSRGLRMHTFIDISESSVN